MLRIQPARSRVELRRRRKVEHVLHLRHVADLDAVENVHAFLHGVNLVAVEIGRALLELGEILDRAQAALRAVNLLVEHAAQADRIQPEPSLLRPDVGTQMELPRRVAVHVAIEAGDAEARLAAICGRRSD